ncbi:MAG: hypothetical protein CEN89_556 [Candidatus Berkelbacteria bacterium Licking1014_7]|uniref:tRNA/rRNA methyltransferase SpoU type domain-containing protein n=1 Tax=Candidatus Berkelbacteria bacterium Licking1014_7 TaxID=2017147 RepID=A0A554LIC4_9BACT|nr:MAG: hypothetical protein CEN89_556 [Candidatus Berkelbacteria bacterium Licking1014_7]
MQKRRRILRPTKDIYLILDNLRSAHNVGAIFRTADAIGVKKNYLCGHHAHANRRKTGK